MPCDFFLQSVQKDLSQIKMEENPKLYNRIYAMVRLIPPGRVTTYGRIAELVGGCTARMVGYAMAALRSGRAPDVPWHRVINAQGKISVRRDGFGSALQRALLEEEGVHFNLKGVVDFARFGWPGPDTPY